VIVIQCYGAISGLIYRFREVRDILKRLALLPAFYGGASGELGCDLWRQSREGDECL